MVRARLIATLRNRLKVLGENKGLKMLSILLALILFLLSRQQNIEVRLNDVPIQFQGLPQGHEILDDGEQRVSVRLFGPEDLVRRLNSNQITVVADLQHKDPGQRVVQLHPEDVVRPPRVKVSQIFPPNIRLQIERTAERTIPIRPRTEGVLGPGVEVYDVAVTPSQIHLEGPESQLNELQDVSTESINLAGHETSFSKLVDVETLHPSIRIKTREQIRLTVTIGEQRIKRIFSGVPVRWPDQGTGGRLLTRKVDVEIYGPLSRVGALTPSQIRVEARTTGVSREQGTVAPTVLLPEGTTPFLEVTRVIPSTIQYRHP
ncbi:MAG: YbbR-like domain-containing protein [Blastocatellia bacterium]